tara:strand:+ start:276 stop:557 length:282 start_codon:yes stop_codon:yes gene_type:complete
MSFIVSNSFNSYGTMQGVALLELFQRLKLFHVKPALNQQPIAGSSRVSVVSYIIHLLNETQKLLRRRQRARIHIGIAAQDYTKQGAAGRMQLV